MAKKNSWFIDFSVFLVVALVYALFNAVKVNYNWNIIFLSSFFWMLVAMSGIYLALSFTKISKAWNIVIAGISAPIIINLLNALFNKVPLNGIYPLAFIDSILVLFLLGGGFFLADKIFKK